MNLAAIAEKPGAISLAPIDPEDDEDELLEEDDDEEEEAEEEEPETEEQSSTPSDIQSILNDVFVDDEAMERYQVLVGDSAPVDAESLAAFAEEIAQSLGASA